MADDTTTPIARDKMGRYHRTPEAIARDAEAAHLYFEVRLSYRQIAEHFGWKNHTSALQAVNRALRDVAEPTKELRDRRDCELQFLWDAAMDIYNQRHIVVSHGQVAKMNGEPIEDHSPKLQALEQMRKINAEWRKLHGSDAAVKADVTVHEVTQQDLELQEMIREAKAHTQAEEQQILDGGTDG
ncbi:hypothetical protein [Streptomyces sp. 1222.5]|uniref:hypothetical protein n=1 Tax=Streptomyces sp. 1222.5 TaxID=1881026 RepID=UPI003EBDF7CC